MNRTKMQPVLALGAVLLVCSGSDTGLALQGTAGGALVAQPKATPARRNNAQAANQPLPPTKQSPAAAAAVPELGVIQDEVGRLTQSIRDAQAGIAEVKQNVDTVNGELRAGWLPSLREWGTITSPLLLTLVFGLPFLAALFIFRRKQKHEHQAVQDQLNLMGQKLDMLAKKTTDAAEPEQPAEGTKGSQPARATRPKASSKRTPRAGRAVKEESEQSSHDSAVKLPDEGDGQEPETTLYAGDAPPASAVEGAALSHESPAPEGNFRFPALVADFFTYLEEENIPVIEAKADVIRRGKLEATEGGEFRLVENGGSDGMFFALPKVTRFSVQQDFYTYYQHYFECESPAPGDIVIIAPAVVRVGGHDGEWCLSKLGKLEVR